MSEQNQEICGKAVASMILGIAGLVAWFIPLIGLPITVIGLTLGIISLKSNNRGMATAGIIMSILGLVLTIINGSIGAYLGATGQHSLLSYGDSQRYVERAGGFSFVQPKGWEFQDSPVMKFKIAIGPSQNGFAPNINVVNEQFKGTLEEYTNANIATMRGAFSKLRIIEQVEFKTTAGLPGRRLVIESEQNDKLLRFSFYFFGTAGMKYVVTCTALAYGGEKLDTVFAESMKTFRIE